MGCVLRWLCVRCWGCLRRFACPLRDLLARFAFYVTCLLALLAPSCPLRDLLARFASTLLACFALFAVLLAYLLALLGFQKIARLEPGFPPNNPVKPQLVFWEEY